MPSVHYNALIDSNATQVWRVLKQFGGISQWHPSVLQSVIEQGLPNGLVGCIRRLNLKDGAVLRERLLAIDDSQLSFSYRFEQAPLPVDDYVMTVKLIPISDQERTVIQWLARFDNREPDPEGQQREVIRELIVGGHHSLQAYLAC
jgi:hypothetical protein